MFKQIFPLEQRQQAARGEFWLQVENLKKQICRASRAKPGRRQACFGVSFDINKGELFTASRARSGCGRTNDAARDVGGGKNAGGRGGRIQLRRTRRCSIGTARKTLRSTPATSEMVFRPNAFWAQILSVLDRGNARLSVASVAHAAAWPPARNGRRWMGRSRNMVGLAESATRPSTQIVAARPAAAGDRPRFTREGRSFCGSMSRSPKSRCATARADASRA